MKWLIGVGLVLIIGIGAVVEILDDDRVPENENVAAVALTVSGLPDDATERQLRLTSSSHVELVEFDADDDIDDITVPAGTYQVEFTAPDIDGTVACPASVELQGGAWQRVGVSLIDDGASCDVVPPLGSPSPPEPEAPRETPAPTVVDE